MDDNMEFQEWEILPESELGHPKNSDSSENQRNSAIVDEDSEGMIRPDYFAYDSVHLNKTNTNEEIAVPDELGFSDIGVSTWVDPCLTSIYAAREGKFSGMMGFGNENSNTSGSESGDFNEGKEVEALDPGGLMEIKGGLDPGNNSKESDPDSVSLLGPENGLGSSFSPNEIGPDSMSIPNNDGSELGSVIEEREKDGLSSINCGSDSGGPEYGGIGEVGRNLASENVSGNGVVRGKPWWKFPLEFLKVCVFRFSPLWSISVAAAVMGFVILGRRWYKIKRKTRTLPLQISVEDKKKVSKFMVRAARFNEAFSVVRRVPIVRSSIPLGAYHQGL